MCMECQIGKNIKLLRKRRYVSREDLAEAMGITVQAVCKWETEKANPDLALLPKLAEYFGVTIDSLFMAETPEGLPEDLIEQDLKGWEAVAETEMQMPSLPSWGFFTPTEDTLCLLGDVRGKNVLEIACGSANSLNWLGEKGAKELWGLDISAGQIKRAKQLLKENGREAKLFVSPMESDPGLPHGHFDIVFCIYGFGWSVDLDKTVIRAAEYLKPGGRLVFSWDNPLMKCIDSKNGQYLLNRSYLKESSIDIHNMGHIFHMHHRKLSTYLNCLANHGFLIEQVVEESAYDENEAKVFNEGKYYSADRASLINPNFIVKARKL